MRFTMFNAS